MTKIKNEDVFQKDFLKEQQEAAEALLDTMAKLRKEMTDILKATKDKIKVVEPDSAENIKVFNDNVKKTATIVDQVNKLDEQRKQILKELNSSELRRAKIDRDRAKIETKLKEATSDRVQSNVELKVLLAEQNKINKQLARESLNLVGAYEKESKRLIKLRKQYKDLVFEEKGATKEAEDLRREIVKLDKRLKDADAAVGQFQRNVGDYGRETNRAAKDTLLFSAALVGLNRESADLSNILQANEEASEDLRKSQAQSGAVVQVLQNRIATAAQSFIQLGKDASNSEKPLFSWLQVLGNIQQVASNIIAKKVVEGVGDEIDTVADAASKATEDLIALEKTLRSGLANEGLLEQVARLTAEFDKQSAIGGDNTKSFNEQTEAILKAAAANEERFAIQAKIAEQELQIIETQVRAAEEAGDEINRNLLLDDLTEKRIALIDAENEFLQAQIETKRALREVDRDRFERELDFAIDAFDAQKTVNERRIADEGKTLDEREKIFNRTVFLADSSFKEQQKLVEGFTKQRLNLNELVRIDDEKVIRERLRGAKLDDVTQGRILEIIRERKLVLQDLLDLEQELGAARQEASQALLEQLRTRAEASKNLRVEILQGEINEIDATIKGQKRATQETIDLTNERFKKQRDQLEEQASFELLNSEITAAEKAVIFEKLQNDLEQLERDRVDAVKQANEDIKESNRESLQESLDFANAVLDGVLAGIEKRKNAQIEALEEETNTRQSEIARQERLAEAGLNNTLAFEKRKLAEAEAERARLQEEQERREKRIAYLRTFAEFVTEDPNSAAGKALAQVLIAEAIAGAFKDGVENFQGKGTETSDSNLVLISRGESVATAKGTKQNPGLVTAMNEGRVDDWFKVNVLPKFSESQSLSADAIRFAEISATSQIDKAQMNALISKFDKLEKTIKNKRETFVNWNSHDQRIETIVEEGQKRVIKTMSSKPRI